MNIRFIRLIDARARFGFGKTTFYERVDEGLMVPPVSLGGRAAGIPEHELEQIAAAYMAGNTKDEIRALVAELVEQRLAYPQSLAV